MLHRFVAGLLCSLMSGRRNCHRPVGVAAAETPLALPLLPSTGDDLIPPIMRQVDSDPRAPDGFASDGGWSYGWTAVSGWNFAVVESTHVVLTDVDGDGDLDVLVASRGLNYYYLNDGLGSLAKVHTGHFVTDPGDSQAIAVGDMDGDGNVDVVGRRAAARSPSISPSAARPPAVRMR